MLSGKCVNHPASNDTALAERLRFESTQAALSDTSATLDIMWRDWGKKLSE